MNIAEAMPPNPLNYEVAPVGAGRYRVTDTPDLFQIELEQRSPWDKTPAVVAIWVVAAMFCVGLWWSDQTLDLPGHPSGKTIVVIVSTPISALYFSVVVLRPELQQLSIAIDRSAVTIVRTMMGQHDRQRIALADLLVIRVERAEPTVIEFVTARGGARVNVARKPQFVAEICHFLRDRANQCQSSPMSVER